MKITVTKQEFADLIVGCDGSEDCEQCSLGTACEGIQWLIEHCEIQEPSFEEMLKSIHTAEVS